MSALPAAPTSRFTSCRWAVLIKLPSTSRSRIGLSFCAGSSAPSPATASLNALASSCAAPTASPAAGVAAELGLTDNTVCKWRSRYIQRGLAGPLDEPRCGAPRRISDEQVEAVLTKTLEVLPRDATQWSTRSMAAVSGLSHDTVHEIWRAFGLQPHRSETFKLSNDPQFIEKVRDIVGLYLDPPERALVLCVDE